MNKSFKNIGASFLIISLLAHANLGFAYYIVLEDKEPQKAAYVTQETPKTNSSENIVKEAQPGQGTNISQKDLNEAVVKLPPIAKQKVIKLRKNPVGRCPTEIVCGNDDTKPVNYTIPFGKAKPEISEDSKKRLSALLPRIKGTKVCIIGRPDFVTITNGNHSKLATSRAYNIRKYLLNNGVPASAITVSVKSDPYTNDDGSTFSSDVIVIEKKDAIEKRKVNIPNIDVNPFIKKVSNVGTKALLRENAKVALIDGDTETISYIDHSVKQGLINPATGNRIKEMIKFNEIHVLKNLSQNHSM